MEKILSKKIGSLIMYYRKHERFKGLEFDDLIVEVLVFFNKILSWTLLSSEKTLFIRWSLYCFSGMVGITERLQDILPILVSCFLDAQSFDCMLLILESINLMIKFSFREIAKSEKCSPHALALYGEICGSAVHDQSFSPAVLKRLWGVFPLKVNYVYLAKVSEVLSSFLIS